MIVFGAIGRTESGPTEADVVSISMNMIRELPNWSRDKKIPRHNDLGYLSEALIFWRRGLYKTLRCLLGIVQSSSRNIPEHTHQSLPNMTVVYPKSEFQSPDVINEVIKSIDDANDEIRRLNLEVITFRSFYCVSYWQLNIVQRSSTIPKLPSTKPELLNSSQIGLKAEDMRSNGRSTASTRPLRHVSQ